MSSGSAGPGVSEVDPAYPVGSLVKARGREWVVLPGSDSRFLCLQPLGGTEDEVAGVFPHLEQVEPAWFRLPDPEDLRQIGDHRSCRLLRDAVRLGFRSSAGPFRCFGRIAVEPRPYQLVPLLMGLKLNPVRLLIADDVGIGKTIEACLLARELLDRGEARRLAVLCPPPLAEQWQAELRDKFHIEADLVLTSTASRLERECAPGQSLFEYYPYTVVSTEFIKSERRRDEFVRSCPELVVVDEAHTCAWGGVGRSARHQRYQLVSDLAKDRNRHLILVTATPHSGNEEAFRSLISFLDPEFANLPEDLVGSAREAERRRLAQHFVQRRRSDIKAYLDTKTVFPEREEKEVSYRLSPEYKKLFDRALAYARETVIDQTGGNHRRRVRWWSALALLRSLASSPAAAAATLRARSFTAETETAEQADEVGRRQVFDLMDAESAEGADVILGAFDDTSATAEEYATSSALTKGVEPAAPADTGAQPSAGLARRQLLEMARQADALAGARDEKLKRAVDIVQELLEEGYHPIVFCRFIPTADYVAEELRRRLPPETEVASVTGQLASAEREERVQSLASCAKRVLVCTDCLSEGINLQENFDAVVHYDLSWNPTRHEQREGRVDRFGQPRPKVKVVTLYGLDNQIDGIVLDVLIRKHRAIRNALGVSVPVPLDTEQVVEAIFEGLLLRESSGRPGHEQLQLFEQLVESEALRQQRDKLHREWDGIAEREKRSRSLFAQAAIKVDEVARELREAQEAVGSGVDVERFVREALEAHRAVVRGNNGAFAADLRETPRALREAMGLFENTELRARFDLPVQEGEKYLSRTHPIVEGLATYLMDCALDPQSDSPARRCGVIRSRVVEERTVVLLVRFRYHLEESGVQGGRQLAEDCQILAFAGSLESPRCLDKHIAQGLLEVYPDQNIGPDLARDHLASVLGGLSRLGGHLEEVAFQGAAALADAHRRVRQAARMGGRALRVEPQLPPDILGVYVYLPAAPPCGGAAPSNTSASSAAAGR